MGAEKKKPGAKKKDVAVLKTVAIQFRVSERVRAGLDEAMRNAGDPTISEFVMRAVIARADRFDVKINRY